MEAPPERRRQLVALALVLACVAAVFLAAPQSSSVRHERLTMEDGWLRASMGQQELWYGAAAGKPGVVLGTWASQQQANPKRLRTFPHVVFQPRAQALAPRSITQQQQSMPPQQYLDEEAPAASEAAAQDAAPAEEANEDPVETAAPPPQQPVEGGAAAPEQEAPCDYSCRTSYDVETTEIAGIGNQLLRLQSTCSSMMHLFDCECASCGENKAGGQELQAKVCQPAGLAQLHAAGGACMGFATGFCAVPFDQSNFCQEHSWIPPMGSPQWMQSHEVVDPGDDGGAGVRLATNQAPAYANTVARAMDTYLSSGAIDARAQAMLDDTLAREISSMKPVHENMGMFSFLPFDVPFLMSVDKHDKPVLAEDHDEQKAFFGEELSVSEAEDYGSKVANLQSELKEQGVALPGSVVTRLNELEEAADHYNGPVDETSWLPEIRLPHFNITF